MARKIRFPLKMTNSTEVRTIEELRANFDLTAVLGYYADGKLVDWLRDRYFENESYDFSGKTVIPFCTHAESGPSGTVNTLKSKLNGAAALDGFAHCRAIPKGL